MPLQLNIFLLLFGALQGVLFTIFLVRKKLYRKGYGLLLIYFGVMLLQIMLKLMSKAWLMEHWNAVYWLSYQLPFLYGPLVFLFVRQVTTRQSLQLIDALHFIPFLTALVMIYSVGRVPIFEEERRLALQLLSLGIYHFFACKQSDTKWLRKFTVMSFAVCSIIALTIYFMYLYFPALNWMRMGFVALTVFIYWVTFEALNQPDIFTVYVKPKFHVHRPVKKYSNSIISDEECARISAALEKLMVAEKPFLDPELTIDKLAKLVQSNRHHLSQVLNQKLGLSFYDYINTCRIAEAKILLAERADHKIAAIAYDAGFNSLSSFNDVFKKMTGLTPSQYRKLPEDTAKQQRI